MDGLLSLNNVATQDRFTDATTLECPGAGDVYAIVTTAAIYYRVGLQPPAGGGVAYGPDRFLPPGGGLLPEDRADKVQVRSAVAGVPAFVTLHPTPYTDG